MVVVQDGAEFVMDVVVLAIIGTVLGTMLEITDAMALYAANSLNNLF